MIETLTQWQKYPSVTSGGKPYFWIKDTVQGRRWIVWDRIEQKWSVVGDQAPPKGESPIFGFFESVDAAKHFVDNR